MANESNDKSGFSTEIKDYFWFDFLFVFPFMYLPILTLVTVLLAFIMPLLSGVARR